MREDRTGISIADEPDLLAKIDEARRRHDEALDSSVS